MASFMNIKGTTKNDFKIGQTGPTLINSNGNLALNNNFNIAGSLVQTTTNSNSFSGKTTFSNDDGITINNTTLKDVSHKIKGYDTSTFDISKLTYFDNGAVFYGTAASGGLMTSGIRGLTSDCSSINPLYLNYDGTENYTGNNLVYLAGTGTDYIAARRGDFKWGTVTTNYIPLTLINGAATIGITYNLSIDGHVHADATDSVSGFMSASDKTKLDTYPVDPATIIPNAALTLKNARSFTIGTISKSFNGSDDVTWTLDELGLGNTANDDLVVHLAGTETITGTKTFAAPADVASNEVDTTWFNTSNGGRIGIGKEGSNSGTSLFFDQVSGTRRLNLRASGVAGAMVWSQPESDSSLCFDVRTVSFRYAGFTMSGNCFYPDVTNSCALGVASKYFANLYATTLHADTLQIKSSSQFNIVGSTGTTGYVKFGTDTNALGYDGSSLVYGSTTVLTSGNSYINNGTVTINGTNIIPATLVNGKVPSIQLPSYVDDVVEADSLSSFPTTGEAGKIYVALDTNKTYRWGGTAYAVISETIAVGSTTGTAYDGKKGTDLANAVSTLQTSVVHNTGDETIAGTKSFSSTIIGSISGNAATVSYATFGNQNAGEHNADNMASNGLYYYTSNGPTTSLGASTNDGAMYCQAFSTSWAGQIAQDYRSGNIFSRGKNDGSWSSWRAVAYADEVAVSYPEIIDLI